LSERIFFFVSEKKARAFAQARAVKLPARTLLILDTAKLTNGGEDSWDLCAFNSGNAMRKPVLRDRESFQKISQYPLLERKRKFGIERAVSEMSTRRRHLDIANALIDIIAV
jgi:hypothetical protein